MKNCIDQKLKNLTRRIIRKENKTIHLNYVNILKVNKKILESKKRKIKAVRLIKMLNNKKQNWQNSNKTPQNNRMSQYIIK